MLIKTAYDRGYIDYEWFKGAPGNNLQSINSEGYEFQHIVIRQDLMSKTLHIKADVIDNLGSAIHLKTVTITKELLEDFGVPFDKNLANMSLPGENLLKKIIDIMGSLNYWSKAGRQASKIYTPKASFTPSSHYKTKTPYQKAQKTNPLILNDQDIEWLQKFNSREKTLREIDQEKEIAALKNTIEELKAEMEDLKEEIQMLTAVNEEC